MALAVRLFTAEDEAAWAEIMRAAYPDYPGLVEEVRYRDAHREPYLKMQRWVAELEGRVVGVADYEQYAEVYDPRVFWLDITVHPAHRRRGAGRALYTAMMTALQAHDPTVVHSEAREDYAEGVAFLERRGFRETMREWESHLDLTTFDPAPYAGLEERLRAHGIEIRTLTELAADPERDRKLHALHNAVEADVPSPQPPTPVSFEHFVETHLHHPHRLPAAYAVAVRGDEYIGLSYLQAQADTRDLDTGLTGVVHSYRGQGIALALKVRVLTNVKAQGYPLVKTWNASTNAAMLAINARLGFVRRPAWITFSRSFEAAGETQP